jgi:hypothetical protein
MNPTRWIAPGIGPLLLCLCVAQPLHAQGGFLKKLQQKARTIEKTVQRTGEQADSALSKAGQTADAVKCLGGDSTCVAQPATSDTLALPPASGFQALPDTSEETS